MSSVSSRLPSHAVDNDGIHRSIWCKVCGISRAQDALAAQSFGADALGFNFYARSPRYVEPQVAASIAQEVSCARVGLFVDLPKTQVEDILAVCELDLLQFHGAESPDYCAGFGMPYMKVLGVDSRASNSQPLAEEIAQYDAAWAILLDTYAPELKGGTGSSFDWSLWPQGTGIPLVLAGGLAPANVREAISLTNPFGVDVASGVEGQTKGHKDSGLLKKFIQEVRSARNNIPQ